MKRRMKIIGFGICFGIILVVIKYAAGVEDAVFWRYYGILAGIILVGSVGINMVYHLWYQCRMQRIQHFLAEERPQEYIVQVKRLLEKAKGETLRNVLLLNLAAGYMEAGEQERAIVLLEDLSERRLYGAAVRLVHQINLCECCFQTNRYEKAIRLYHENAALFARFREDKIYGASIAVLDILAAYYEGQAAQAKKLTDAAQQKWKEPRFQRVFREIAAYGEGRKEREGE